MPRRYYDYEVPCGNESSFNGRPLRCQLKRGHWNLHMCEIPKMDGLNQFGLSRLAQLKKTNAQRWEQTLFEYYKTQEELRLVQAPHEPQDPDYVKHVVEAHLRPGKLSGLRPVRNKEDVKRIQKSFRP